MVCLCVGLGTAACTKVKAKATPELPPLEMPAPPPRDVDTTEPEPMQPIPLIAEPAHNAPARPRPAPAREPRAEAPKAETPKTEPAPTEAAPPPSEEPHPPAPTLQTTPAAEERDLERVVRSTMSKANADLSRVDYRTLNSDARTQYDYAKRFIRQAEDAVRAKNLVYAKTVADKAAAIAAQLTAR